MKELLVVLLFTCAYAQSYCGSCIAYEECIIALHNSNLLYTPEYVEQSCMIATCAYDPSNYTWCFSYWNSFGDLMVHAGWPLGITANEACVASQLCEGGCCLPSAICTSMPQQECVAFGGEFIGVGVACNASMCLLGGCCLPNASYAYTSQYACSSAGGSWLGTAVVGNSSMCQIGGCCNPLTMACSNNTYQYACSASGGVWQNGLACGANGRCGACCNNATASCSNYTTSVSCTGTYLQNQTCASSTCGACCTNGSCSTNTISTSCLGTYYNNSICTSSQCGACCKNGAPTCIDVYNASTQCSLNNQYYFSGNGTYCNQSTLQKCGSCCVNGSCARRLSTQCAGGTWDNTSNCDYNTSCRACCYSTSCADVSVQSDLCPDIFPNIAQSTGSYCAQGSCAACCASSSCVYSLNQDECVIRAARGNEALYQGAGWTCPTNPNRCNGSCYVPKFTNKCFNSTLPGCANVLNNATICSTVYPGYSFNGTNDCFTSVATGACYCPATSTCLTGRDYWNCVKLGGNCGTGNIGIWQGATSTTCPNTGC